MVRRWCGGGGLKRGPVVDAEAGRIGPGQHQHPARLTVPVPAMAPRPQSRVSRVFAQRAKCNELSHGAQLQIGGAGIQVDAKLLGAGQCADNSLGGNVEGSLAVRRIDKVYVTSGAYD